MLYNLLLYIRQILAFLCAAASSLPFLIALGLIIGRRGHAAFCLYGSRRLSGLAKGLALAALFYFPVNYLAVVLPYGLSKNILGSLFLPQGRPWLAAGLCWLAGCLVLFLAAGTLGHKNFSAREDRYQFRLVRTPFLLFSLTSLAFLAALFVQHWPFAGLPEGMSMERAAMAITRNSMRLFFQSFSPAGALALLYAAWCFSQPSFKNFSQEKSGALRWFSFWAAAGAIPALFISWGMQLASWSRASLAGIGSPRLVIFALIFQTLAIAVWIWIIFRPEKASWRIALAFVLTLLNTFWSLLVRMA